MPKKTKDKTSKKVKLEFGSNKSEKQLMKDLNDPEKKLQLYGFNKKDKKKVNKVEFKETDSESEQESESESESENSEVYFTDEEKKKIKLVDSDDDKDLQFVDRDMERKLEIDRENGTSFYNNTITGMLKHKIKVPKKYMKYYTGDKKTFEKQKVPIKIGDLIINPSDSDTESESKVKDKIDSPNKKREPLPIEKYVQGNIDPCINPFGFAKSTLLNIKQLNELGINPSNRKFKEPEILKKARELNVGSQYQSNPVVEVKKSVNKHIPDKNMVTEVNKIVKMDRKEREAWRKEVSKKIKDSKKIKKSKKPSKEEVTNSNILKMKQEHTSLDRMMLFNLVEHMYQHLNFKKCELEDKCKDVVYEKLLKIIQTRLLKNYKTQEDMEENIDKEVKKALRLCKKTADEPMIKGYYLDYMSRLPKKNKT